MKPMKIWLVLNLFDGNHELDWQQTLNAIKLFKSDPISWSKLWIDAPSYNNSHYLALYAYKASFVSYESLIKRCIKSFVIDLTL